MPWQSLFGSVGQLSVLSGMVSPSVSGSWGVVGRGGIGIPVVRSGVDQRHEVSLYDVAPGQSGMPVLALCRGSSVVVPKSQGGVIQPVYDDASRSWSRVCGVSPSPPSVPLLCTR